MAFPAKGGIWTLNGLRADQAMNAFGTTVIRPQQMASKGKQRERQTARDSRETHMCAAAAFLHCFATDGRKCLFFHLVNGLEIIRTPSLFKLKGFLFCLI